ncbi:uncharacterized protein LOC106059555 [Biomphalaria glabrata]|uniref:Uncharacterized protein LOC106059555 n=1 Tax=Biomphalaria glabrata TaxID=6526 RepID=A0A9W2YRC4_BIOGL|nr:uncharacterized protein LOC106059555 [Biomphalaria glabrata]KAI8795918.1 CAunnamed protein product [Biomphalaria glabrata]
MDKWTSFVFILANVFLLTSGQNACQSSFLTTLNYCLGNRTVNTDNFLYLVRDGKLGKAADDPIAFLNKLCSVRESLTSCVRAGVDTVQLMPDTQCNSTQKASIVNLYKSFFKVVNKKCENPCRSVFKQGLTKCFTDQNFRLTDYLIFSPIAHRDYILGTNKTEVQRFCDNRTVIMQCMRSVLLSCEDGPHLLDTYGLDLDALSETYTTLCNYTEIYMEAVKCYEFPVNPVLACRNTLSTRVTPLDGQFEDLNMTSIQYRDEICKARLDQVQCEMDAVKPGNDTDKCNAVVVGLRKQQECQLLPKSCRTSNSAQVNNLCRETDFKIAERVAFTQALISSGHVPMGTLYVILTLLATSMLSLV